MRLYRKPSGIYYREYAREKAVSLKTRNQAEAQAAFNRLKRDRFRQHVASLEGRSTTRLGVLAAILDEMPGEAGKLSQVLAF